MNTVWMLVLVLYTGGYKTGGGMASEQVGPYPTQAACESVRNQIKTPDDMGLIRFCVPRMKLRTDDL